MRWQACSRARLDSRLAVYFLTGRKQHGRNAFSGRSVRHDGREITRPVAELVVQRNMLGALPEGEEPGVAHTPSLKDRHRGLEQPLGYPAVPIFRQHGQGAKEPERSPPRDDVRSNQAASLTD